jgi:hypothetical protein
VSPGKPSGFGPLSALWWPLVLLVLWPLAGLSLLVWPADRRLPGRGGAGKAPGDRGSYPRASRGKSAVLAPLAALLALSACSPDFRGSMGGPPQTARAEGAGPTTLSPPRPPVVVDNPLWCHRRASP